MSHLFRLGVLLWWIVSVARWSASGGESVPAVIFAVDVVRFQSMRVAVLWKWLYLVGVVIVVWSPFVCMNWVIL